MRELAMTMMARLRRHWKVWAPLGAVTALLIVMVSSGFALDLVRAAVVRLAPPGLGALGGAQDYFGPSTLEERIVLSDVVARVKLNSVSQVTERVIGHDYQGVAGEDSYVVALEFTFDVLEYLKGSGGSTLTGVADDNRVHYETALAASTLGEDLLSERDGHWDDREAVVFLRKSWRLASTKQADRYRLGNLRTSDGEYYTLASDHYQAWLPDAAAPASTPGVAESIVGGQRFLLDVPKGEGASAASGASGTTEETPTIALAALKTLVEEMDQEVAAGGSSTAYTAEEYRECVYYKYEKEREVGYKIERDGAYPRYTVDAALDSGAPAGTFVEYNPVAEFYWSEWGSTDPGDAAFTHWMGGRGSSLFTGVWPGYATTVRPLLAGEYRFFYSLVPFHFAICDGLPQEEKERVELVVTVTAPSGTVHEAFFDPAAIGTAVGADPENGTLSPDAFTVNVTPAVLQSLTWESGAVTLTLDPYASLAGGYVDFIALDGTVALTLSVDAATADAAAGTLTWAVASQPWSAHDQLMLRIRDVPPTACQTGTAVPNPTGSPDLVRDCDILLDVLDVLLGVEDDPLVHWSSDKPMDDWRGVRMSGDPVRVTRLELAYKGLNGTLPAEIAKLDALTRVDMRGSYLTGSIPSEWGGLTDLEYLHLAGNDLTGSIRQSWAG